MSGRLDGMMPCNAQRPEPLPTAGAPILQPQARNTQNKELEQKFATPRERLSRTRIEANLVCGLIQLWDKDKTKMNQLFHFQGGQL